MERRESGIMNAKRFRKAEKDELMTALFGVREGVGRVFMRKAVFLQRSLTELAKIAGELAEVQTRLESELQMKGKGKERKDGGEMQISENILRVVEVLREDVKVQRKLDEGIWKKIQSACQDGRFLHTGGEKVGMKRFEGFVGGRLKVLGEGYARMEGLCAGVMGMVGEGEGC